MPMDPQTAVTVAVPVVGCVVWLIRLEGQVKLNSEQTKDLREDVRYIRNRIDRAINGHHLDDA